MFRRHRFLLALSFPASLLAILIVLEPGWLVGRQGFDPSKLPPGRYTRFEGGQIRLMRVTETGGVTLIDGQVTTATETITAEFPNCGTAHFAESLSPDGKLLSLILTEQPENPARAACSWFFGRAPSAWTPVD